MEGAFAWVGQLVEWLGSLIPRVMIVRATHGGVKFRQGRDVEEVKPGLIVYWPFVTEVDVIPVARQTQNLPTQCIETKDRVQVTVGGVVVYRITDVVKALSRNWDFTDTINDITLTAILPIIMRHSYDELLEKISNESIQKELTKAVRSKLRRYGVSVSSVGLTDFAKCIVLKNIGAGPALIEG